jgi:hypothetical protein
MKQHLLNIKAIIPKIQLATFDSNSVIMEMEFKEPALAYGKYGTMEEFLKFTETSEFKFEY